jgi:hypothetical protein
MRNGPSLFVVGPAVAGRTSFSGSSSVTSNEKKSPRKPPSNRSQSVKKIVWDQ